MRDWLSQLSAKPESDEQKLEEAISQLPAEELYKLAADVGVETPTPSIDTMAEKIASADELGRALAHEHGDALEKQALLELLPEIGEGLVKSLPHMGMSMAANKGVHGLVNAGKRVLAPSMPKLAFLSPSAIKSIGGLAEGKGFGFLRGAARVMKTHPVKALGLGGAAIGGAYGALHDPGIDPETGQRRSRLMAAAKGALVGGGIGAGLGGVGRIANAVRAGGNQLSQGVEAIHPVERGPSVRGNLGHPGQVARAMPSAPVSSVDTAYQQSLHAGDYTAALREQEAAEHANAVENAYRNSLNTSAAYNQGATSLAQVPALQRARMGVQGYSLSPLEQARMMKRAGVNKIARSLVKLASRR